MGEDEFRPHGVGDVFGGSARVGSEAVACVGGGPAFEGRLDPTKFGEDEVGAVCREIQAFAELGGSEFGRGGLLGRVLIAIRAEITVMVLIAAAAPGLKSPVSRGKFITRAPTSS